MPLRYDARFCFLVWFILAQLKLQYLKGFVDISLLDNNQGDYMHETADPRLITRQCMVDKTVGKS